MKFIKKISGSSKNNNNNLLPDIKNKTGKESNNTDNEENKTKMNNKTKEKSKEKESKTKEKEPKTKEELEKEKEEAEKYIKKKEKRRMTNYELSSFPIKDMEEEFPFAKFEPEDVEIKKGTGLSEKRIDQALQLEKEIKSSMFIDAPLNVSDDGSYTYTDIISEDNFMNSPFEDVDYEMLDHANLTDNERKIIKMHEELAENGKQKSFQQIATELNISRQAVQKTHKQAMEKLYNYLNQQNKERP